MPDYRELYLELFRATTRAIDILIEAQQWCEERYLQAGQAEVVVLAREQEPPQR